MRWLSLGFEKKLRTIEGGVPKIIDNKNHIFSNGCYKPLLTQFIWKKVMRHLFMSNRCVMEIIRRKQNFAWKKKRRDGKKYLFRQKLNFLRIVWSGRINVNINYTITWEGSFKHLHKGKLAKVLLDRVY